jgi:geranylgeranyl diphosphate synthase, type II
LLIEEFLCALNKYLPRRTKLAAAMRYSVEAGGKRFRPRLCLAAAKALGKDPNKVMPVAVALELIHTFTLVHDDLPGMDNSDLRRGRPTCHKRYGEATAILAGDALNTLAFEILARETRDPKVIEEVGHALMEVVDGQMLDLASEGKRIKLKTLRTIHKKKTAALLRASVRAPAIQLKASPARLKALTAYADHLGLAFQITDDILDVTASQQQLGKPVKADQKKGFPYIVGLEQSKKMAQQEMNKALSSIKIFGKRADELREIAAFVIKRKK